jgi:hypothetical protein
MKRYFEVWDMRSNFLHPGHQKIDFDEIAYVLSMRMVLTINILPSERLKMRLVISMKQFFMMSKGHLNAFTTFLAFKKAI